MINNTIKFVITAVILCIALSLIIHNVFNTIKSEKNKMELLEGERVIVGKDTLIILDYSMSNDSYKLSNRTEISVELANKLIVK